MGECEYWQALISRMLDGDLSAEEEAALAKHLEGYEECRTLYGAFAAVSSVSLRCSQIDLSLCIGMRGFEPTRKSASSRWRTRSAYRRIGEVK